MAKNIVSWDVITNFVVDAFKGYGIPEEDAVMMATENPARLMKLNKGVVAEGYDADLIFVDDSFELKSVMIGGKMQEI